MPELNAAIEGVLDYIHAHIEEPLTLPELARYAAYSQYHFSRLFKQRLGISLRDYVASLRLHRAKELLLSTNLNVRQIALEIGHQSLGTFTTRFTAKVGVTPARFRASEAQAPGTVDSLLRLDLSRMSRLAAGQSRNLTGTVRADVPYEGIILLGLFSTPIPEGIPLYSTMLPALGDFCFPNVKHGTYYLMGTSIARGMQARDILVPYATLRTTSNDPIVVHPRLALPHQRVTLSPPQLGAPPVLISVPFLISRFLRTFSQQSI